MTKATPRASQKPTKSPPANVEESEYEDEIEDFSVDEEELNSPYNRKNRKVHCGNRKSLSLPVQKQLLQDIEAAGGPYHFSLSERLAQVDLTKDPLTKAIYGTTKYLGGSRTEHSEQRQKIYDRIRYIKKRYKESPQSYFELLSFHGVKRSDLHETKKVTSPSPSLQSPSTPLRSPPRNQRSANSKTTSSIRPPSTPLQSANSKTASTVATSPLQSPPRTQRSALSANNNSATARSPTVTFSPSHPPTSISTNMGDRITSKLCEMCETFSMTISFVSYVS